MSMKYIAAYALASLSKQSPSAEDVEAVCKAAGIQVDKKSLDFVVQSIAGRDVASLIAEGAAKMSAAAVSAAPAAGGAAPAAAAAAPAAAKKEEKEEEEDDDMGFGLFD